MMGTDVVVHFAAESHVTRSIYDNQRFYLTDVIGTQVVATAALKHDVRHFVHISTSEVYGTAEYTPMDELHPLKPRSPYASAKCGADRLVYSYMKTYDLPAVILRPFNQYGPKQHLEKVIPQFISRALSGRPLVLHGGGCATRDWQYVYDTCAKVCEIVDREVIGREVNLGSGQEISVRDVANAVIRIVGGGELAVDNDRMGQVSRHISSTDLYDKLCGPMKIATFEEGIVRTIHWYRTNDSWRRNEWMKDILLERK